MLCIVKLSADIDSEAGTAMKRTIGKACSAYQQLRNRTPSYHTNTHSCLPHVYSIKNNITEPGLGQVVALDTGRVEPSFHAFAAAACDHRALWSLVAHQLDALTMCARNLASYI